MIRVIDLSKLCDAIVICFMMIIYEGVLYMSVASFNNTKHIICIITSPGLLFCEVFVSKVSIEFPASNLHHFLL